MSLINDALKRAKQNQQDNPPPPLQFRGVDPQPKRSLLPVVAVSIVALLAFGATALLLVYLIGRDDGKLDVEARTAPPLPKAAQPVQSPEAALQSLPKPLAEIIPPSVEPVAKSKPDETLPAPTFPGENDTNTMPAVAANEPPKPPLHKLQGIFFNPARPSAVVNGKTVFVGSVVGNSRVADITRETVTLISATSTNVLSLSE